MAQQPAAMLLELRVDDAVFTEGGEAEEREGQIRSCDTELGANSRDAGLERPDRTIEAHLQVVSCPLDVLRDHIACTVDAQKLGLGPSPIDAEEDARFAHSTAV